MDLDLRVPAADAQVIILPETFDAGVGTYPEWEIDLVRDLRLRGFAVVWATEGDHRRYRSQHSAELEAVVQIGMVILNPDALSIIQVAFEYLVAKLTPHAPSPTVHYRISTELDPETGHIIDETELDVPLAAGVDAVALLKEANDGAVARLRATRQNE